MQYVLVTLLIGIKAFSLQMKGLNTWTGLLLEFIQSLFQPYSYFYLIYKT